MTADQVASLLDQLTQRLQGPAAQVFAWSVREQIIEGALALVVWVVVTILFVIALPRLYRWTSGDDDSGTRFGFAVFGGIVALLIWLVISVDAYDGVLQLLNPQYAALSDLLSKLHP